jgi:nucleotide-binding universal stress UspA family protein
MPKTLPTSLTTKHPADLTESDVDALLADFDATPDSEYVVVGADVLAELRSAAATRRAADARVEAAVANARRSGLSWGVIGPQLGLTRQGARQRFDR